MHFCLWEDEKTTCRQNPADKVEHWTTLNCFTNTNTFQKSSLLGQRDYIFIRTVPIRIISYIRKLLHNTYHDYIARSLATSFADLFWIFGKYLLKFFLCMAKSANCLFIVRVRMQMRQQQRPLQYPVTISLGSRLLRRADKQRTVRRVRMVSCLSAMLNLVPLTRYTYTTNIRNVMYRSRGFVDLEAQNTNCQGPEWQWRYYDNRILQRFGLS